jgi:hypothetical protein
MREVYAKATRVLICNGKAFYIREGEPVQVRIDGRIMVDAAFFRKVNPNYFRPTVIDVDHAFDLHLAYNGRET